MPTRCGCATHCSGGTGKTVSDTDPARPAAPAGDGDDLGAAAAVAADAAAPDAVEIERRLHPLSWLFVLLTQLRPFVVPVALLLIFRQGDSWVLWGALGALVYSLYALVASLSFRYRIGARELHVRSGLLSRSERHVPYERIQNIVQRRNLLHRMFGVTELRLESAGGAEPEAVMNVITLAAAAEIEAVLRRHGNDSTAPIAADASESAWHELRNGDLFRLGLITDRGGAAIGALVALWWQFFDDTDWKPARSVLRFAGEVAGTWSHAFVGWMAKVAAIAALALLFMLVMRVLSIVMAFITFHGFRLVGDDLRLSTEAGLLTRRASSARRDKIQRLIVGESWLARRLGRRTLSCEVAAGAQLEADAEQEALRLRWLAPIGSVDDVDRIVARVLPGVDLAGLAWRPLHPDAWRRLFKIRLLLWLLPLIPLTVFTGPWALLVAPVSVFLAWRGARGWAAFAAYACNDDYIAFRAGWLTRQWTVARIDKGQTLSVSQNPFDRRRAMATVSFDTAGATLGSFPLSIPYLPIDEARALAERLRVCIAEA